MDGSHRLEEKSPSFLAYHIRPLITKPQPSGSSHTLMGDNNPQTWLTHHTSMNPHPLFLPSGLAPLLSSWHLSSLLGLVHSSSAFKSHYRGPSTWKPLLTHLSRENHSLLYGFIEFSFLLFIRVSEEYLLRTYRMPSTVTSSGCSREQNRRGVHTLLED